MSVGMDKDSLIAVYNDVLWKTHRKGFVEFNLENLKKKDNKDYRLGAIKVLDANRKPVEFQFDRIDSSDTKRDSIVFLAEVHDKPSIYHISEIDSQDNKSESAYKTDLNKGESNIPMKSEKIEMILRRGNGDSDFAGSAQDIIIKKSGTNITKPFGTKQLGRLMQLEHAYLPQFGKYINLSRSNYELVGYGSGPIRTFVSLRLPFHINFEDGMILAPEKTYDKCNCNLYRLIYLYRDNDFVIEDVFIETTSLENSKDPNKGKFENIDINIQFTPSFWSHVPEMDRDAGAKKYYPEGDNQNRGWFAVGNESNPQPGFGFACTSPLIEGNVNDFGEGKFKWGVSPCYNLRCLHLFMDQTNSRVDNKYDPGHVIGANWFNTIFKPLWTKYFSESKN